MRYFPVRVGFLVSGWMGGRDSEVLPPKLPGKLGGRVDIAGISITLPKAVHVADRVLQTPPFLNRYKNFQLCGRSPPSRYSRLMQLSHLCSDDFFLSNPQSTCGRNSGSEHVFPLLILACLDSDT